MPINVELGIRKAFDPGSLADRGRSPFICYTHIPDNYGYDPGIDVDALRCQVSDAVLYNGGITSCGAENEALLPIVHPTMGILPSYTPERPSWVKADDPVFERILSEYFEIPAGTPANYEDHWRRVGNKRIAPGTPQSAAFALDALHTNVGVAQMSQAIGGGSTGTTGTATATSATSLTNSGASWATNAWAGYIVIAGGVFGVVVSNTATVLTIDQWYALPETGSAGSTPSGTTVYAIIPGGRLSSWYMGITTTNITPAVTDTSLSGEATANGMARKLATYTVTSAASSGAETFTLAATYTYSTSGSLTFYALGLFTSAVKSDTTDTMCYETSFSSSATVQNNGDQLTVTDTLSAS